MEGALREDVIASKEAGWVSEARAQDVVIGCGVEVDGVFLKKAMARDDLCADRIDVSASLAIFAQNAGIDGMGLDGDGGGWWDP